MTSPKKYWIITTSLVSSNFDKRKSEYIRGITTVIEACKNTDIQIIIVENNGPRETFLDIFKPSCKIHYTTNNQLETHYGVKELFDVLECISTFNIQDNDYVIKSTGRYYLNSKFCPFLDEVKFVDTNQYDTIIKYGWWEKPSMTKVEDCILGLICLKTKYIKQIDTSYKVDYLEHRWARVTLPIPDTHVKIMHTLGIFINPGSVGGFFEV
jgi:hypothetical protein